MNNKKKLTFLSVILASALIMAACNAPKAGGDSSSVAPDTSSVEQSSSGEEASSSSQDPTPSSSSQAPGTSSSSSSSSSAAVVELVSISVKAPTKVDYTTADTALDLAGMVVTAQYSDRSSKTISTGYTVSTVDFSTPGQKTVTVTYQNKTATFTITVAEQKFTVKFVVNGTEVQTGQVVKGQYASYTGDEPTKAGDAENVKYRFIGWDKDPAKTAITQDTTFTAQFKAYAAEQVIDDFESYTLSADVIDAGWKAIGWSSAINNWSEETPAAVSLGTKSVEGSKALRFDAWENGNGYKFAKEFQENEFPKSANALKFRLMIPSITTVKVLLYAKATIAGQEQVANFHYTLDVQSSEYVEYIIPIADAGWAMYGEAGKSFHEVAGYIGIHEDDVVNHLTKIEFYTTGNDGIGGQKYIAFLDSASFVTIDNPVKSQEETMGQYNKYTGLLADGHTVRIDLGANGSATATVLDAAEQQQQIPGNVAIDANKQMTFTSADGGATLVYTGKLVNGGQSIKYVSASGAFANAVANMQLNAVQVVDNYEQYTSDGKSYYQSNLDINNRSGCRGAYYSEYYSGGAHDYETFGGNGWVLMAGDGSQLKMKNDGGHSGNNYLCLKNSSGAAMRYMQWGLFDGTAEQNNFRGSKLSFWAKTNSYVVKSFKVSMYSQTKPRNATKDEQVRSETFTQTEAIGQWKHFEVDLNPALTYYGFLIFMEKTGGSDAYLYIDDVEVYTANPYAVYVPEVPPVEYVELKNGQVFFANISGYASSTLVVKKDNAVEFNLPMSSTTLPGTYAQEDDQVTFDFGAYGTMVMQLNEEGNKMTKVSATGVAETFGNIAFDEIDVLDNAESYTESGKMYYQSNTDKNNRSGARGAYYCDYYSGGSGSTVGGNGWSLMGGNGDQLSLETSIAHSGSNSLKLKRNNGGAAMRYMTWGLMDGSAEGHTGVNYFLCYMKNPNAKAATIKTSVYYQAQVTPSTQQSNRAYLEVSLPANADWTPVVIPLDPAKTYYGVAYSVSGVSQSAADYIYVDDAMFFSEEMNVTAPFLAIKGLKMDGALANGAAASIILGEHGNVQLACEALGGTLNCKFTLIGSTMTITAPALQGGSGTTIVGTYVPTETEGVVAFTVTSCTGDMAAYLPANTIFQGSIA